uniref:Ig-like domain-containing protein n=1 Tax=Gopherus evgoodei TaxID=1825980 RepID=A0A8C4Y3P6_9SAUR
MAWAPLLLTLLTYCSGVSLQPMVTQEPSISVIPGGTVALSCSLSTGAITTSNYPGWFQQKPGSAPRQLIYYTNNRLSGIPARFSGSISSNDAALTITDVQAEDEADYYCAVWYGSGGHFPTRNLKIFGHQDLSFPTPMQGITKAFVEDERHA